MRKFRQKAIKKFPRVSLPFVSSNQLKIEYNRIKKEYKKDDDYFKRANLEQRANFISFLLKERGENIKSYKGAK